MTNDKCPCRIAVAFADEYIQAVTARYSEGLLFRWVVIPNFGSHTPKESKGTLFRRFDSPKIK